MQVDDRRVAAETKVVQIHHQMKSLEEMLTQEQKENKRLKVSADYSIAETYLSNAFSIKSSSCGKVTVFSSHLCLWNRNFENFVVRLSLSLYSFFYDCRHFSRLGAQMKVKFKGFEYVYHNSIEKCFFQSLSVSQNIQSY